jgi:hypothetical protein
MKPSKEMMGAIIAEFYRKTENICGGTLHIVLEDGNTEDHNVEWCKRYAEDQLDYDGVLVADLLLKFTEDEREEIICNYLTNS